MNQFYIIFSALALILIKLFYPLFIGIYFKIVYGAKVKIYFFPFLGLKFYTYLS